MLYSCYVEVNNIIERINENKIAKGSLENIIELNILRQDKSIYMRIKKLKFIYINAPFIKNSIIYYLNYVK